MNISVTSLQSMHDTTRQSLRGLHSPSQHPYRKKRIGPYYYYPDNCIGSGYSSKVYKAFNNEEKDLCYAIKVIRLGQLDKAKRQLLDNQIKVLKDIDHPNLLKLEDIFYTPNHCYIITEYCQGGTLQNHIEFNPNLDWEDVCTQLLRGLSYLSQKCIVHRDIKPANIFFKEKTWKIGDFGFSRYLPTKISQVQELYMVGSPLYMPPQTLQKKIYSLKTDCFAFGILLFHLVTREFPWSGRTKQELLNNYSNFSYPAEKITHLAPHHQVLLKGLCEIEISRRINIEDFQGMAQKNEVSNSNSLTNSKNDFMECLSSKFRDNLSNSLKITFCKFIHYIDCNIQHFEDMCELSESLRRILKSFSIAFGWNDISTFSKYMDEFKCRNHQQIIENTELLNIKLLAHSKGISLQDSKISRCIVLNHKLKQLAQILDLILVNASIEEFRQKIGRLVLHPDFSRASVLNN